MTDEVEKDESIQQLDDKKLKQLAQDLLAGRIFTDRHMNDGTMAQMVFMPISFFDEKQMAKFKADIDSGKIFMIYEYVEKAGPRTVNGMPIFMSYRSLNKEQFEKVMDYFNKIKAAIDAV